MMGGLDRVGEGETLFDMARAIPSFARNEVNAAARRYVEGSLGPDEVDHALEVINNWRSSHSFPLNTFGVRLRRRTKEIDPAGLVAQRIKRLSSIVHKIERFPRITLTQMQDIGGCRAVLSDVAQVEEIVRDYETNTDLRHELIRTDNYIVQPPTSGYRGVHLIWRYRSDRSEVYNGLKIEMQLRTRRQHAWATAVETVGTFTRQALKSSQGEHDWLRFFALMASAIAIMEGRATVPDTPTNHFDLQREIGHLALRLDVANRLEAFGSVIEHVNTTRNAAYYILQLTPVERAVSISGFSRKQLALAQARYLEIERAIADDPTSDAVLVSIDSIDALQRAFPNYFLDTRVFIGLVHDVLSDGLG